MLEQLTRNWWAVGLRGILAILLGISAFVWPGITLEALIYVFGAYAILDGGFALVTAGISAISGSRWVWMLFEGILSIITGLVALAWPGITALSMLLLIAAYAIITGIFELAVAFQFSRLQGNGWFFRLSGVFSIIFGFLLLVWPDSGLLTLVWLSGFYAIFFGIMLIELAFQFYHLHNQLVHSNRDRLTT